MGGDAPANERRAAAEANRFRKPEGAVRRGRGGKEKEWDDCVQSDIRAFGIAGDWKATALRLHYTRLFPDPRFLLFVLQNIAGYKNAVECLLQ